VRRDGTDRAWQSQRKTFLQAGKTATGFFHVGLAASARDNLLTQKGIKTCHWLKPNETLRIPYIQGVARVPRGFDRVASIEVESANAIRLVADSGASQVVPCRAEFARTGELT